MTEKLINMHGRYRTRDGREADLIYVHHRGEYPVAAIVDNELCTYTAEGRFLNEAEEGQYDDAEDLIEVAPPPESRLRDKARAAVDAWNLQIKDGDFFDAMTELESALKEETSNG